MSAVARVLNIEVPRQWARNQLAPASPASRWGQPIWAAEEPVVRLQGTLPDALPLEITLQAFVYNGR